MPRQSCFSETLSHHTSNLDGDTAQFKRSEVTLGHAALRAWVKVAFRGLPLIALGLLFGGCATSPQVSKATDATSATTRSETSEVGSASMRGARVSKQDEVWPDSSETSLVMPSALTWSEDEGVLVGYGDGTVALVKPGASTHEVIYKQEKAPVMSFSTDGEFVVMGTNPVSLVNLRSQEVILRLNRLSNVKSTAFSGDSGLWFVTDSKNRVHVWETGRLSAPKTGEDIRDVIRRETADFSVQFPSVGRRLMPAGAKALFFSDVEGMVFRWDIKVQEVQTLMRMKGEITAFSRNADHFAVTSASNQLRILNETNNLLLPWTHKATGERVAIIDGKEPTAAVLENGALALKSLETGKTRWTRTLPQGVKTCGLSATRGDAPIVLCLGGALTMLAPEDGALLSVVRNLGGELVWKDAAGQTMASNQP